MSDYTNFDPDGFLKWKPEPHVVRKIVCAAAKYGEGKDALVVCSARHYDVRMNHTLDFIGIERIEQFELEDKVEQGFIDQFGVFVGRKEAWKIAVEANQINLARYPADRWREDDELYSEWLY